MAIQQMMIYLHFERTGVNSEGIEYPYFQCIEVDLVNGDIQGFLDKIPDDVSDHSSVWVSITRADGTTLAYVDGMIRETKKKGGVGKLKRIRGKLAEALRHNVILWTQRYSHRQQKRSDVALGLPGPFEQPDTPGVKLGADGVPTNLSIGSPGDWAWKYHDVVYDSGTQQVWDRMTLGHNNPVSFEQWALQWDGWEDMVFYRIR